MDRTVNGTVRRCSKCGKTEEEGAVFWRDRNKPSGYRCSCRDCCQAYRKSRKAEYDLWYKARRQEKVEYDRKRYQEKWEQIRARQGKYYQKRKGELKAKVRQYALDNQEKVRRNKQRYYRENAGTFKDKARVRKAVIRSMDGHFSIEEWNTLCGFFGGVCPCCGKEVESFTVDHIVPVSWEGSGNDITNIQPLCFQCNAKKKNFHATDYRPSKVRQWAQEKGCV